MPSTFVRDDRRGAASRDPWAEALGEFLSTLLEGVEVRLEYVPLGARPPGRTDVLWSVTRHGPGWTSVLSVSLDSRARRLFEDGASQLPWELAELPDASLQALERVVSGLRPRTGAAYPALRNALHDVVVAEMLADKLVDRSSHELDRSVVGRVLSEVLEYV